MPAPIENKNRLGATLKDLRTRLGFSQEAIGAQGFVSAPGYIKIENGQRQASEKLIQNFTDWLVSDKHMSRKNADGVKAQLLTAKYLDARSPFVRDMAANHARSDATLKSLLAMPAYQPARRGRPPLQKRFASKLA